MCMRYFIFAAIFVGSVQAIGTPVGVGIRPLYAYRNVDPVNPCDYPRIAAVRAAGAALCNGRDPIAAFMNELERCRRANILRGFGRQSAGRQ